ncbi:MAG: L,D-transpeptidase family protein [Candidatus Rifleibacteriota bacterium]
MKPRKTLSERLEELAQSAAKRIEDCFGSLDAAFPPAKIILLILKQEKRLEVFAGDSENDLTLITTYPILAASGHSGPKLRDGDLQIPEGIYKVDFLNPNSLYHLSLKLNYPNEFDRLKAQQDNRFTIGNNIMIHGNQVSRGCVAIGDEPIEEVFYLAAKSGRENIKVIISPVDFRTNSVETVLNSEKLPKWASELYKKISAEMSKLPADN